MFASICLRREDRTRLRTPGRVAHPRRVVPYHEHGGVPEILEGAQLLEYDGEAEVDVRGRGVYPQLDPQRLAACQAAVELLARDHIHRVLVDRSVLRIAFINRSQPSRNTNVTRLAVV